MEENLVTTEKNSISALSERTEHVLESLILKKTIYTYNYVGRRIESGGSGELFTA